MEEEIESSDDDDNEILLDDMDIEVSLSGDENLGFEDGNDPAVQLRRKQYLERAQKRIQMLNNRQIPYEQTCVAIVENIKDALPKISRKEHLSGLFQALVACCAGSNIPTNRLAKTLDIAKKTARAAKTKRESFEENQPHSLMLEPPVLTKNKIEETTLDLVNTFIADHVVPSSSAKNVVKKKSKGKVQIAAKNWRTESIESLYDKYIDNHPQNWISFGAFYKKIPWYVHAKPQRSGLCVHHDRAYKVMKLVKNLRTQWHQKDCSCKCDFCSKTGCNHGQDSTDCLEGLCKRCSKICCPLEKTQQEHNYTIVEYIYEKTERGNKKLRQTTNSYVKSRKSIMKLWKEEMEKFKEHSKHVKYHKEQMKILFESQKKSANMVIARWDFAENYVHESGSMVSTEHYGKEQSQLLIVSYWCHSKDSTPEVPDVKLKYMAFTSDYLSHNTVFFKKCLEIFMDKIKKQLPHDISSLHILTDGAQQHFKNKRAYNNVSILSYSKGLSDFYLSLQSFFILKKTNKTDIPIEWTFDPPHHGKGPCDGMAAVIKRTARSYIIRGNVNNKKKFKLNLINFFFCGDGCHVNNYIELSQMVTNEVRNCEGIPVPMVSEDVEEEVESFEGILSYFHMSFKKQKNSYTARRRECFCSSCQSGNFDSCHMRISPPSNIKVAVIGQREPKGREVIRNAAGKGTETEEFVVEKIAGKRTHKVKKKFTQLFLFFSFLLFLKKIKRVSFNTWSNG